MSPLRVFSSNARRPDGNDRNEHEGTTTDDTDDTDKGRGFEVVCGGRDVEDVLPASEAGLAAISG
jgi:hypothetical protein